MIISTKPNSRNQYNRSQQPVMNNVQNGGNNIGVIQNFNNYHIELKNMNPNNPVNAGGEDNKNINRKPILSPRAGQNM